MDAPDLIEALRDPAAWPRPVDEVGFLQTHISLLFFVGEHVYKVKKTLQLPFLDASTLARRKQLCEDEVRLNARLAPDTYLGVVPIVRDPSGRLAVGASGEAVEYAVEMKRLPAERMLERLLERGAVDNALMNTLARRLADFHAQAATGPGVDEHGSPEVVRRNVLENFTETARFVGDTIPARVHEFLRSRAEARCDEHAALFEQRVRDGRIRDGHGDLHGSNICYLRPDELVIYDCIEFSDRFRCGDIACDIAFLAMDLDRRGFPAFGRYFVHRYAKHAHDPELEGLMPFYKAYRALVRFKVSSFLSAEEEVPAEDRAAARHTAMSYAHLAAAYDLPPAIVLMCGLPACGKTWCAERVAPYLDPGVLSSDVIRKQLAGIPLGTRHEGAYEEGIYSPEAKRRTYATLLERALELVRKGRTAVIDATFLTRAFRAPYLAAARQHGIPLVLVHIHTPEEVIAERMERRANDPREASDATFGVYLAARDKFEPPDEFPPEQVVDFDSPDSIGGSAEALGLAVVERRVQALSDLPSPACTERRFDRQ